jgi:2-oxoisovalerate dehydrogenase E2 component (dihydrolipoyl transacylase)
MSRFIFRMPDLGEGTVAAEVVAVHVAPGDVVTEEQIILDVMTEKATVEVPSPVSGRVVSIAGKPGDSVAVGAELIVFETDAAVALQSDQDEAPRSDSAQAKPPSVATASADGREPPVPATTRVMASPATRRRAREAGVDLVDVVGSGPGGRILREDFDNHVGHLNAPSSAVASAAEVEEVPVIGMRRLIAQRMTQTLSIPHFSYVEEIDVTELESLRLHLNTKLAKGAAAPYTYLPFLVLALTRVLPDFPQCNAHYDAERNVVLRYRAVHVGIATQTADGLKVPVVRNAAQRSLAQVAAEIRRVSEAVRANKAKREELSGSTITLTSLGKLGGIASTPIINAPEVAIIGINKAVDRPMVVRGVIAVRRMMNISGSFDHRFVDGHDAASMIQSLKQHLEHPATIFTSL